MFGTSAYARNAVGCASLLVAVALGGCAEERSFYILQNQVPSANAGECTGNTDTATFRSRGKLDVSAGQGYLMYPLLQLDIEPSVVEGPERNKFVLRHYHVSLDLGDLAGTVSADETSFDQPTSGTLEPGSMLGGVVEVIRPSVARALANQVGADPVLVTVKLRAVAVRLGTDSELESATFHYPIDVCKDCLVTWEQNGCPDKIVVEEGAAPLEWESNACGLPQDTPVTCCTEEGRVRCLKGSGSSSGTI